jgi:hypothetical protein
LFLLFEENSQLKLARRLVELLSPRLGSVISAPMSVRLRREPGYSSPRNYLLCLVTPPTGGPTYIGNCMILGDGVEVSIYYLHHLTSCLLAFNLAKEEIDYRQRNRKGITHVSDP